MAYLRRASTIIPVPHWVSLRWRSLGVIGLIGLSRLPAHRYLKPPAASRSWDIISPWMPARWRYRQPAAIRADMPSFFRYLTKSISGRCGSDDDTYIHYHFKSITAPLISFTRRRSHWFRLDKCRSRFLNFRIGRRSSMLILIRDMLASFHSLFQRDKNSSTVWGRREIFGVDFVPFIWKITLIRHYATNAYTLYQRYVDDAFI